MSEQKSEMVGSRGRLQLWTTGRAWSPLISARARSRAAAPVGTHSACGEGMDLYDVRGRGFHSPLNAREISRLYRFGQLDGRHPCKPKGEAKWHSVDELFPLLRYEAAAPPLRFDDPQALQHHGKAILSVCVILVALAGMAAFHLRKPDGLRASGQSDGPNPAAREAERIANRSSNSTAAFVSSSRSAPPLEQASAVAGQRRIR